MIKLDLIQASRVGLFCLYLIPVWCHSSLSKASILFCFFLPSFFVVVDVNCTTESKLSWIGLNRGYNEDHYLTEKLNS
jgi:hypothetical protein